MKKIDWPGCRVIRYGENYKDNEDEYKKWLEIRRGFVGGSDAVGLGIVVEVLEVRVRESLGIRLLGRALFGRFVVRSVVVRTGGKSERTEREDHGDRKCQSQDSQFS